MESVKLAVGEYPRFFVWPVFGATTAPTYYVGSVLNSYPLPRELLYQTFMAWLIAGSATPSVTLQLQGTNDPLTGQGVTLLCTLNASTTVVPTPLGQHTNFPVSWIGSQYVLPGSGLGGTLYVNGIGSGMSVYPALTAPGANIVSGTTTTGGTNAAGIQISNATGNSGVFQLAFYNNNWANVGASLTTGVGTPPNACVGLADVTPYRWFRVSVTAVAGTSPQALVSMGG